MQSNSVRESITNLNFDKKKRDIEHVEKAYEDSSFSDVSLTTVAPAIELDSAEDRRIIRKMDWRLIPFVSFLYLLSFLDRSNIGNAKIVGLVTDINLKGLEYNICAALFFVTYALAEIPSNLAMKVIRPSRWIPSLMLGWGIVVTLTSLVKNFPGLAVARLFLGLTEGGLFPGVTFYLSMWYRRNEQAYRIALFFSAATAAGAFGGLLSAAIAKMNHIGGLHGWSWIFLIEGLFTCIVSIGCYFVMHDYPATAKFLTEPEREHVIARLKADNPGLSNQVGKRFVWQAFADYKSYMFAFMYLGTGVPLYAFSLFLPTIIKGLGYTSGRAQLLSVPPYVGGCIATIVVGAWSDKYQSRGPFVILSALIGIAGYAVLLGTSSAGAGYAGACIAALGVFPIVPVAISWVGNNVGGDTKRGVVIAMVIGFGNIAGGTTASFIYLAEQAPRYPTGHATVIGFLGMNLVVTSFLMLNFNRLNKQKAAQCLRDGIDESRAEEFSEMGDASPLFKYVI